MLGNIAAHTQARQELVKLHQEKKIHQTLTSYACCITQRGQPCAWSDLKMPDVASKGAPAVIGCSTPDV